MQNWKFLAFVSLTLFSLANILYADLSHLGFGAILYCNQGTFLACLMYYAYYYSTFDYSNPEFLSANGKRRYILTNALGKIDMRLIAFFILGACGQASMFLSTNTTFRLSQMANLNFGISSSVWAMGPFVSALMERVWVGTRL